MEDSKREGCVSRHAGARNCDPAAWTAFRPSGVDEIGSRAEPSPLGARFDAASRLMGGLVALIGASVLVGWALDVPVLKSLHPRLISMKPNTALAFVLLGIGLATGGFSTARRRVLARTLGALVALLGAANLAENVFEVDLHIDEVLFSEPAGSVLTTHPGRMSLIACLSFVLLGTALLLALGSRAARLAAWLGAISFGLALLAIAGYGYGISTLYDLAYRTPLALNSAVAFLLASTSVLLARTDSGFAVVLASRGAGGVLARRLLPFAVALPLALDFVVQVAVRLGVLDASYDDAVHGVALSCVLAGLVILVAGRLESADEERRRISGALRVSEAHFRSLFENMTSGCSYHRMIFEGETAVDYEFLAVNSAFERQTGLPRHAIVGRRASEVVLGFAESGRDLIARCAEVARTGKAEQFDHFDAGLDRWYSVSAYRPEPGCFATVFLDITDRKRQTEEVSQRLELLRRMGNDILLLVAPDGSIVQANDRALQAYGYAQDEMARLNIRDLRAPETHATVDGLLNRALTEDGLRFETRHLRRDGSTFPVEVSTRWMEIGGRRLVQSVIRDLGEERAARAAVEYQAMLLENLNDAVIGIDSGFCVNAWNHAAERIFGRTREEAMGHPVGEVVPESLRAMARGDLDSIARGEKVQRELKMPRPDGSEMWLLFSRDSLRGPGGLVSGSVSVFTDVTPQRRAQQELEQARKLEAVGQLAAGIAHELNTPIQFIGDNTRFLDEAFVAMCTLTQRCRAALAAGDLEGARGGLDQATEELDIEYLLEQVPKTLKSTAEGVRRVSTIVRAMKEFAHPDRTEMVATDLNRAILATLEVARNEYKYVADVHTDLAELPAVTCYAGDLNQVFLNLIVNAAHAIEQANQGSSRRGRIQIATRQDGRDVVVTFADTGCGIPEAIRHKVFDPFFTTKEVGKGTGQGLAIAQRIIAKHKGQLTFTTQVGQGTTFLVRLPTEPAAVKMRECA